LLPIDATHRLGRTLPPLPPPPIPQEARMRGHVSLDGALLTLLGIAGLSRRSRPRPPIPASRPIRRIGRNERCPCGSGIKFKRCCGR